MKYIYYAAATITILTLVFFNYKQKSEYENKIVRMQEILYLDSAILHNYQRAMGDFIDENPECAYKFSILIEQHDIEN